MSLKRRNLFAWVLVILAAFSWTWGQQMLQFSDTPSQETTASPIVETTGAPEGTDAPRDTTGPTTEPGTVVVDPPRSTLGQRMMGFVLSFVGIVAGCTAIFALRQSTPILGPDCVALIGAAACWFYAQIAGDYGPFYFSMYDVFFFALLTFAVLLSARELWGWIRAKFPLSWCLVHRIAQAVKLPQLSLMVYLLWILGALVGILFLLVQYSIYLAPLVCVCLTGLLGVCCLWKYGSDLHHFQNQLNNFQQSQPITVKDGSFAQAEARLLEVQEQHAEAIRTAVTSERFKVELISNVSHDLRTPLTAILGYSELLQKEALSPEGQAQLARLHQEAGYMNELVESLFELTKVSSGVVESKKEQIDLVRLLEQTIGLFDDQLVSAGLTVKRSYCADTIPAVTDGARMHQVFANLLGNAIKYALAGTRIYLEVKETKDRHLVRMVNTASYEMDFEPDEILQRFARGDKARSTKGSGLGLAIAQTYTESVGGSFRVVIDGDQFSAIVELPKN